MIKGGLPAFIVAAVMAFLGPATAQDHLKSTWYLGFGVGTGNGSLKTDAAGTFGLDEFMGADGVDYSPRITYNAGLGAIVSSGLHLGFDISGIYAAAEASGGDAVATFRITNYLAMVSFFPTDEGLFVRLGAGAAAAKRTWDYGAGVSGDETYSGYGVLGGAGYAFWVGETLNLVLNFDYSYQSYGEDLDATKFWNVYVSFYWF